MIEELTTNTIVLGMLAGALFGVSVFANVRLDPDNPEPFDPIKFGTTVILGGIVGGGSAALGVQPTYDSVGYVLASYIGTIAPLEYAIKALVKGERRYAQRAIDDAFDEFVKTTLTFGTSQEDVAESIDRGAEDYAELDESERRDAWDEEYPDEDTEWQADDETLGEGEYEGENQRARMGETDHRNGRDANDSETGDLPPA